jgi:hypothetical protein
VLGIGERISIGAFLLWVAVLAVALWRAPSVQPTPRPHNDDGRWFSSAAAGQ